MEQQHYSASLVSTTVVPLDGEWLLATDPQNIGREQQWWNEPLAGAKETKIPGDSIVTSFRILSGVDKMRPPRPSQELSTPVRETMHPVCWYRSIIWEPVTLS